MHDPNYLDQISSLPNVCNPRRPILPPAPDLIQRGDPRLVGFFVLEPDNEAYLSGRRTHLARPGLWTGLLGTLGMAATALFVLITANLWGLSGITLLLVVGVFGGMAILAGGGVIKMLRENARYESAHLLVGTVSRAEGRWLTAYSGSTWAENRRYEVTIHYRFISPEGYPLEGWRAAPRYDLTPEALPLPGTPVAVLYRDPEHFRLL